MGGKKQPEVRMPTASELAPVIDLQAQYNRVGVQTPFGAQRYELGPDGRSSTMVTDIGPEGQALVGRAVGLGMTDSARMQVPDQINQLTQALTNRIGSRFGNAPGQGMEISSTQRQVHQPQKPQPRQPSAPSDQYGNYGGSGQGQNYGGARGSAPQQGAGGGAAPRDLRGLAGLAQAAMENGRGRGR